MKPKVLMFHPALAPYRLDLFNAIGQLLNLHVAFLRTNVPDQNFDQEALMSRLDVDHSFMGRGIEFNGRVLRTGISRKIREYSPSMVITSEFSIQTLSVMIHKWVGKAKYRHIVWTDDNPVFVSSDSLLRRLLRRLILPRLDGLILVSEDAKRHYADKYPTIPSMASVPILQEEMYFRKQLQLASAKAQDYVIEHNLLGRKVVLYVGRLAVEKSVGRLIQAFVEVSSIEPDAVLVIVGSGPERSRLESLATDLGVATRVLFAGRYEGVDLAAWYRVGGLFVLASESEPFGAVVNEALLAGMPVICSRNAGAHVLIEEGVNGRVVNASINEQLVRPMIELLSTVPRLTSSGVAQTRSGLMAVHFSDTVREFHELICGLEEAEG